MNDVKELAQAAGLAAPRSDVDNLAFFQVRGDCLAPDVLDGDVLFAAWRPAPASQAGLRLGDLAVFLLQEPGRDRVHAVLKRWQGSMAAGCTCWPPACAWRFGARGATPTCWPAPSTLDWISGLPTT